MKHLFYLCAAILMIGAASCGSSDPYPEFYTADPTTQAQIDENAIIDYLRANNLVAERTSSGIYYIIETEGNGTHPTLSNQVTVHYSGTRLDGFEFDSSYKRGQPATFPLRGVVQGWQEGIPLFSEGGKGTLLIPSGLGYGARGAGANIPPNTPLVFAVELVKVI